MSFPNLPSVPGYGMAQALTVANSTLDSAVRRFVGEVTELTSVVAQEQVDLADLLDEVVDVVYTARRVAIEAGITQEMLDQWAADKGALRASMGKNKERERTFALGLLVRACQGET